MNKRNFLQSLGSFLGSLPWIGRLSTSPAPVKALKKLKKAAPVIVASSPLDQFFINEAVHIRAEILRKIKQRGCISVLVEKGEFPKGVGFNFKTESSTGDSASFDEIENGVTLVSEIPKATTVEYSALQETLRGEKIYFVDAKRAFNFQQHVDNIIRNFVDNSVEIWEEKDTEKFIKLCRWKFTAGGRILPFSEFPVQQPSPITEDILECIYTSQVRNGAGCDAFLFDEKGKPLLLIIASSEQLDFITKTFKKSAKIILAEPSGLHAEWLKERLLRGKIGKKSGILSVAGFVFIKKEDTPRHDIVNGEWVQAPKWASYTENQFNSELNPNFINASTEDIIIWNSKTMTRLCPEEDLDGVGRVEWLNIQNGDVESEDFNPLKNTGSFYNFSLAAWRPTITQFGAVIRVARHTQQKLS